MISHHHESWLYEIRELIALNLEFPAINPICEIVYIQFFLRLSIQSSFNAKKILVAKREGEKLNNKKE